MKRSTSGGRPPSHGLLALLCMAALAGIGCDNDVNFSPTVPTAPVGGPIGDRNLQISGSLKAERGACLEATILYDDRELPGARATCLDPGGCAVLELAATTPSDRGHHTVSFQVLRQSARAIGYRAEGEVLVSRDGLRLPGVTVRLGPVHSKLEAGESVSFDLDFED